MKEIEEEQIDNITDNKLLQQLIDKETPEVEQMIKDFQSAIS